MLDVGWLFQDIGNILASIGREYDYDYDYDDYDDYDEDSIFFRC